MPLSYQVSYFATAFLNVIIALAVVVKRPQEKLVRLFGAFITSISAWIVTLYFFYTLTDPVTVLVAGRINFVFAEMIAYFAFLFVYEFPKRTFTIPRWVMTALAVVAVALMSVTFATDLVDQNEIVKGVSRVTVYGPLYNLFIAHFIGYSLASIILLAGKYRVLGGVARQQILVFAVGWGGTAAVGITTNILWPLLFGNYDVQNVGPLSTLVLVCATAYAVARHELLSVKLIATEAFVALMLLLFVINIAISPSLPHQVIGGVLLMLVAGLGAALISAVNAEVQRREELQTLSAKLAEANVHLKELDKLKSEFISIASHQLRTPISVIKGYLTLFLDGTYGKFEPTATEKLDQMYAMVERLVHMINNLLSVSRIEGNRIEFACAMFDVGRLVKDVVDEMNVKAAQKKMEIVLAPLPAKPLMVYSDASKLAEVLTNLLDNAVKYSDVGPIDVRVRQQAKRGVTVISIKDKGVGMTPDETKHMFEKFFRAKEPLVAHKSGTGLGLYICAKFMKAMGGEAVLEKTEPGKGSTFSVIVPMRPGVECKLPHDDED